jgi:signal transduction histidine kinase/DNA-binding response OmpR family regulator
MFASTHRAARFFWIALAAAVGLVASYFEISVLPGVGLNVTGVFYLTIALLYGPAEGALCAAAALLPTIAFYHQGYSILLGAAEAAAIGLLVRRRLSAPSAAVVFWIVLGLPLLALIVFSWLHLAPMNAWAVLLKRLLNGFVNVVIADFLCNIPAISRWLDGGQAQGPRPSLRQVIASTLLVATMLPIVILSIAHGRSFVAYENDRALRSLTERANNIAAQVEGYLRQHRDAVISLAGELSRTGLFRPADLRAMLDQQRQIYGGFLTMLAADARGAIVAASSPDAQPAGLREDPIRSVADRPYFQEAAAGKQNYISDVFLGRGLGQDPIVAISTPVTGTRGRFLGIVEGSLDLRRFQQFERIYSSDKGSGIALVDHHNRVIYASSQLPCQVLDDLTGTPFLASLRNDSGAPEQKLVAASARVDSTGWTVYIERPLSLIQQPIETYYLRTLIWLLVATVGSAALAHLTARRITAPLEALLGGLRNLDPADPAHAAMVVPVSGSAPRELTSIQTHFNTLVRRLNHSYAAMTQALAEREALNGQLQGVLADLDRKVQERTAELTEARARAEDANRAKSLFLASMSHEIRTPLNAVIGVADLLANGRLPNEERSLVEIARDSAHGLLQLINEILDFSKIESGHLELEHLEFDARDVADSVAALLAGQAYDKGLEIFCRVAPDVPARLVGDPNRLRQVLTNLASNAVKFTKEGRVVISARLQHAPANGTAELYFEVSDTGVGIPMKAQAEVFDAFTQADPSTTRQFGGSGLGLAISKRIVSLMGGTIGFWSEPGLGSSFWFTVSLPLAGGNEMAPHPDQFDFRVLLVEDDPVRCAMLQRQLEDFGVGSEYLDPAASPLAEGLQQAASANSYGAVLVDYNLPAREQVENLVEGLPVVLLCWQGNRSALNGDERDGHVLILRKPVLRNSLLECLHGIDDINKGRACSTASASVDDGVVRPSRAHTRVLVVEDNAVNQKVILRQLEKLGYSVEVASNGALALEKLDHQRYDLVLMDCQMPVMDGYAAAREIRRREDGGPRTTIVAITANAFAEDRENCQAAGMDDYIAKPVDLDRLAATLARWT